MVLYAFSNLTSIHDKVMLIEAADDVRLTLLDARRYEKSLSAEQQDEEQLSAFWEQLGKLNTSLAPLRAEIIAEINHAPRLAMQTLLAEARRLVAAGADRIDVRHQCNSGDTGGDESSVVGYVSAVATAR